MSNSTIGPAIAPDTAYLPLGFNTSKNCGQESPATKSITTLTEFLPNVAIKLSSLDITLNTPIFLIASNFEGELIAITFAPLVLLIE